jgi:parallel beta-helix repeat protein
MIVHVYADRVYKGNVISQNVINVFVAHSKCVLRKNRISHCVVNSSVIIENNTRCRLVKNIIEKNSRSGIEIRNAKTKVALSKNVIRMNATYGVYVHDGATCELEENTIEENVIDKILMRGKHTIVKEKDSL